MCKPAKGCQLHLLISFEPHPAPARWKLELCKALLTGWCYCFCLHKASPAQPKEASHKQTMKGLGSLELGVNCHPLKMRRRLPLRSEAISLDL